MYIKLKELYLYQLNDNDMKLNDKSLINVLDSKGFKEHHLSWTQKNVEYFFTHYDKFMEKYGDDNIFENFSCKEYFYSQKVTRRLIFSKKSLSNLDNYQVPKEIRVEVLRTLPNRVDLIQLNNDEVVKYVKTDKMVCVTFNIEDNHTNEIKTFFFSINLETGYVSYDNYDYQTNREIEFNEMKEKYYNKFMVVVTYLELTPVTYSIIEGQRSYGTKKEDKVKNETNKRFIMVKTNWNVETISLFDIHVRGHWRLQPHGVGRSQYKYIYIQPFEKGITRRLSQRELVS